MMQLKAIGDSELNTLYKLHMRRDFPRDELAPLFVLKRGMRLGVTQPLIFTLDGQDVGYAVLVVPKDSAFTLLQYFAILPEHRSRGLGSQALAVLAQGVGGRTVILEAEDPAFREDEREREIARRRVGFYQRAGYRILPTKRARIFGVGMLIMASDDALVSSVREIMHALYLPTFGSALPLCRIDVLDPD